MNYFNKTFQEPLEVDLTPQEENEIKVHVADLLWTWNLEDWDESVETLRAVIRDIRARYVLLNDSESDDFEPDFDMEDDSESDDEELEVVSSDSEAVLDPVWEE